MVLAIGAHRSWTLDIEGENLTGVEGAAEFLRRVEYLHNNNLKVGKRVAVMGGGKSAIDAARTAKRLGAAEVTILYRRERKDMPAWQNEIEAALHEGIVHRVPGGARQAQRHKRHRERHRAARG